MRWQHRTLSGVSKGHSARDGEPAAQEMWLESIKSIDNEFWTSDGTFLPSRNLGQNTWLVQVDGMFVPHQWFLPKQVLLLGYHKKKKCIHFLNCYSFVIFILYLLFKPFREKTVLTCLSWIAGRFWSDSVVEKGCRCVTQPSSSRLAKWEITLQRK